MVVHRSTQPGLEPRERRIAALTPQAAGRDLDQRQQVCDTVGDGVRVVAGVHRAEQRSQLRLGPRPLVQQRGRRLQDRVHVQADQLSAERAAGPEATLRDRLDQGSHREEVTRGREVQRRSMQGAADHLAPLDHPRQGHRIEVHQARPERHVRIHRHLGLHRREVLDDLDHWPIDALQQHLPSKQCPVELARTEDPGHSVSMPCGRVGTRSVRANGAVGSQRRREEEGVRGRRVGVSVTRYGAADIDGIAIPSAGHGLTLGLKSEKTPAGLFSQIQPCSTYTPRVVFLWKS